VAKEAFAPVPQSPPAPDALTHDDLRRIMDAADMVESWLSAVRTHVRSLIENGLAQPEELGYKLVAGRASRKWKSEDEAEKALKSLLADPDEAYVRKLLSPAQAEKLLKGADKKALDPLVEVSRGVQLAPLSDKREAIMPAIAAFGEVEL
jgi:predicted ArsR family transcriptional regulator